MGEEIHVLWRWVGEGIHVSGGGGWVRGSMYQMEVGG